MKAVDDKNTSLGLIDAIIFKHNVQLGAVIPVLQEIQDTYGYIPQAAIRRVADQLGIFASDIYGIVTFYAQFRLQPPGKHIVRVCHGTACHLGGAEKLTEAVGQQTGTTSGKTSKDGKFTVEKVACLGCCSLAPCVTVDGEIHGRLNPESIGKIIDKLLIEEKAAQVE